MRRWEKLQKENPLKAHAVMVRHKIYKIIYVLKNEPVDELRRREMVTWLEQIIDLIEGEA